MGKILEPALQDYFNQICCDTPPQGLITLTGGVADGLYTDLASAITYIQQFTSATITDASLSGDVFKFTVPANTTFGNNFLINSTATSFVDNLGLISVFGSNTMQSSTINSTLGNSEFGESSFAGSSGNYNLGNCVFAPGNFNGASGVNTINNILLTSGTTDFADNYAGTMNISGNIGTTESNDYLNFFTNASVATINVLASKQTSDGGNVEGDILNAINNGAQVNFVL
jgi:hypothetical protein